MPFQLILKKFTSLKLSNYLQIEELIGFDKLSRKLCQLSNETTITIIRVSAVSTMRFNVIVLFDIKNSLFREFIKHKSA